MPFVCTRVVVNREFRNNVVIFCGLDNDQFVFDLPSGKMDDSYWDEILKKSRNASSSEVGGRDRQPENSQMSMSTSSETKSQQSDNSSFGDVNKSRALSQISSADSGFSR